jgi:hypothetical protein
MKLADSEMQTVRIKARFIERLHNTTEFPAV